MTAVDSSIVSNPKGSIHEVLCHRCGQEFNALAASWCSCEGKRTLRCPHCSSCFCRAPASYRETFWNEAPRSLRENTNRYSIAEGPGLPAGEGAAPTPRVLIVDDEEDMRSLVACYVEQMGYEVATVSSAKLALGLLATASFGVVITDALMPEMDGRELCLKLKQTYGEAIKVIVMTSLYTASRYKNEARYQFGVDEYLAKPFQYEVLKAALDRIAPLQAA